MNAPTRHTVRRALLLAAVLAAPVASAQDAPRDVVLEGWVWTYEPNPIIRGETDPVGTVVSSGRLGNFARMRKLAYLRTAGDASELTAAEGRWCLLRGTVEKDALHAGHVLFPPRSFDILHVAAVRAFADPLDLRPRLRGRILRDLFAQGADYSRDGTRTPVDGPNDDGVLPDGRRARRVPLVTPPADSADMYTETAWVDRRTRTYWAVRTGGLLAVVQWVGPFPLPRRRR